MFVDNFFLSERKIMVRVGRMMSTSRDSKKVYLKEELYPAVAL